GGKKHVSGKMERVRSRLGRGSRTARRGAGEQVRACGCGRAASLSRADADDFEWRIHAGAANRPTKTGGSASGRTRRRGEPKARHQSAAIPGGLGDRKSVV